MKKALFFLRVREAYFSWLIVRLSSYNYIFFTLLHYPLLLLHTSTHLDRLCDCESFRAGQCTLEVIWNKDFVKKWS